MFIGCFSLAWEPTLIRISPYNSGLAWLWKLCQMAKQRLSVKCYSASVGLTLVGLKLACQIHKGCPHYLNLRDCISIDWSYEMLWNIWVATQKKSDDLVDGWYFHRTSTRAIVKIVMDDAIMRWCPEPHPNSRALAHYALPREAKLPCCKEFAAWDLCLSVDLSSCYLCSAASVDTCLILPLPLRHKDSPTPPLPYFPT